MCCHSSLAAQDLEAKLTFGNSIRGVMNFNLLRLCLCAGAVALLLIVVFNIRHHAEKMKTYQLAHIRALSKAVETSGGLRPSERATSFSATNEGDLVEEGSDYEIRVTASPYERVLAYRARASLFDGDINASLGSLSELESSFEREAKLDPRYEDAVLAVKLIRRHMTEDLELCQHLFALLMAFLGENSACDVLKVAGEIPIEYRVKLGMFPLYLSR